MQRVVCSPFCLTPMEFFIKFDTVMSGCSVVYIERLQVNFFIYIFLSLKINFVLANSGDPDKMLLCGILSWPSLFAIIAV